MARRDSKASELRDTARSDGADVFDAQRGRLPVLPAVVLGVLASMGCMQPYRQTLDPEFVGRARTTWPDVAFTLTAEDVARLYYVNAMVGLAPDWGRQTILVTLTQPDDPVISVAHEQMGVVVRAGTTAIGNFAADETREKVLQVVRLHAFPPASMREGHLVVTAFADGEQIEHTTVGYSENYVNESPAQAVGMGRYHDDDLVNAIKGADPFAGATAPVWMFSVIAPADSSVSFSISWHDNPGVGALD